MLDYSVKYSWALDPFGYSATAAYLLKQSGIEGLLIQRVHYAMKDWLADHQMLEFAWRQPWGISVYLPWGVLLSSVNQPLGYFYQLFTRLN